MVEYSHVSGLNRLSLDASSMAHHRSIAVAFVLYITSVARGLIVVDFYPFGKLSGDAQLRFGFHKLVNLSTAVVFHGEVHRSLYVSFICRCRSSFSSVHRIILKRSMQCKSMKIQSLFPTNEPHVSLSLKDAP